MGRSFVIPLGRLLRAAGTISTFKIVRVRVLEASQRRQQHDRRFVEAANFAQR